MNDDESTPLVPEPDPVGLTANDGDLGELTNDLGLFTDVRDVIGDIDDPLALTSDVLGLGLDALGMVTDPLGSLLSVGIGWLIEHVGFTKQALDYLAGDPDAVTARANAWSLIANKLDTTAQAYTDSLAGLDGFQGGTAEAYRASVRGYAATVELSSSHARNASSAMNFGAMVVGVNRGMVKDTISNYASDLIVKWTTATALAPVSFGASEALFITDAIIEGSVVAGKNVKKVQEVVTELEKLSKRVAKSRTDLNAGSAKLAEKLGKHNEKVDKVNTKALKHVQRVEKAMGKRADLMASGRATPKQIADSDHKLAKLRNHAGNVQDEARGLRNEASTLHAENAASTLPGVHGETIDRLAEVAESPLVGAAKESWKQVVKEDGERQEKSQEEISEDGEKWRHSGHLW